jgi:phosphatidylglycerol:prolipoprotein diacylglycerol transferase
MHPILFEFEPPGFLRFLLPETVSIYSYGTMIALGAMLGFAYTAWQAKKQLKIRFEITNELILLILIFSIIGGKIFVIFEDFKGFISDPGILFRDFKTGFVFFGSLLFAIPTMLIFFWLKKIPALPMLDIMAITTCIVHGTGRIGCFFAGCCHGIPYDGFLSIVFTDPVCQARPLNTPLHPTQLYSMTLIYGIMIFLLILSRRKKFNGQIFLSYLILYSAGRMILELFRGDISRGYVIQDALTNSQLISIMVIIVAIYFYIKLKKRFIKSGYGTR